MYVGIYYVFQEVLIELAEFNVIVSVSLSPPLSLPLSLSFPSICAKIVHQSFYISQTVNVTKS